MTLLIVLAIVVLLGFLVVSVSEAPAKARNEVLPPGRGKKMVTEDNVDEESSAGQIEWYSRQPRAT